jgi:hypothetical protein
MAAQSCPARTKDRKKPYPLLLVRRTVLVQEGEFIHVRRAYCQRVRD